MMPWDAVFALGVSLVVLGTGWALARWLDRDTAARDAKEAQRARDEMIIDFVAERAQRRNGASTRPLGPSPDLPTAWLEGDGEEGA